MLNCAPGACQRQGTLVTHVGRWKPGSPPEKLGPCSVRSGRFLFFPKSGKLYDVRADPGEEKDLAGAEPQVVKRLSAAYDAWWDRVQPALVNEDAHRTAPKMNTFHRAYWEQYKGPGPNGVAPPAGFDVGAAGGAGGGAGGVGVN